MAGDGLSVKTIGIMFSLGVCVVLISFTGPVFGLTDSDATTENEIPNLTVGENQFDIGEAPEKPGGPSSGELVYTENGTNGFGRNQVFITGSSQNQLNGIELVLIDDADDTNNKSKFIVNEWDADNLVSDSEKILSEGDTYHYRNRTQGIVVEVRAKNVTADYDGNGNMRATFEFDVEQTPSSEGVFASLPIVGGVISGTGGLASLVGWIGSTLFYLCLLMGEGILNALVVTLDVVTYFIDLTGWMFGNYLGVVDNAPGWARVIVALPGIIFAGLLSKFVAVTIGLMPTT